jgi:hypothetical protein
VGGNSFGRSDGGEIDAQAAAQLIIPSMTQAT